MDDAVIVFGVFSTLILAAWCAFLFRCATRELREMEERARQVDQWRWERTEKITE